MPEENPGGADDNGKISEPEPGNRRFTAPEAVHFVERVERAGFYRDYVTHRRLYTPTILPGLAMAELHRLGWYHNPLWTVSAATLKPG